MVQYGVSDSGERRAAPAPPQVPLLTNHHALQRLALYERLDMVIHMLPDLPLFAPSSLVSLQVKVVVENSEAKWKGADLALCDSKFPRLTHCEFIMTAEGPTEYFHKFFQQVLPNSYKRGIIWLRIHATGMFIFI